jgi:hypothetical protein
MMTFSIILLIVVSYTERVIAQANQDTLSYVQYKGSVVDSKNKRPLIFATISILGTNIATISNSEGEFSLKVPKNITDGKITTSYLGYKSKVVDLKELKPEKNVIALDVFTIPLREISIVPVDPNLLIQKVMEKRKQNYSQDQNLMTAFYRETIKKRKTYVSLSESVVEIQKQPYYTIMDDVIQLFKGRKNTDYTQLDTITFKLQGGPYSSIYLDVMKYPEIIFTDKMFDIYRFTIENNTQIDDRQVYVVSFEQRPQIDEAFYYGKLYIDTKSLAIISATFSLNVSNRVSATSLFLKRRPAGARVYPTKASYQINYREKDGKWIFGYSRGEIIFKVDWDRKLFNTVYESTIEMAVTDWGKQLDKFAKPTDRLRQNVIMSDRVSDFFDAEFWGEYNIIEPEKPIEAAILKIQKNLEK